MQINSTEISKYIKLSTYNTIYIEIMYMEFCRGCCMCYVHRYILNKANRQYCDANIS